MNPLMGNAFDYNVNTEWAPGFVSLLLYLFDFVNMDSCLLFQRNVATHVFSQVVL